MWHFYNNGDYTSEPPNIFHLTSFSCPKIPSLLYSDDYQPRCTSESRVELLKNTDSRDPYHMKPTESKPSRNGARTCVCFAFYVLLSNSEMQPSLRRIAALVLWYRFIHFFVFLTVPEYMLGLELNRHFCLWQNSQIKR